MSYTSADRPWAEWIAWELEHAGYRVIVQAWDFGPGANFVLEMDEAARVAKRTIAVLSPAFVESPFCRAEWAVAFREDPTGAERKLLPVRVRECAPDGQLGSIVYVDLVGLSEPRSREALLAGVTDGRAKSADAPAFPGTDERTMTKRVRQPEAGAAIFNVPVATHVFIGRKRALNRLAAGLADNGVVAVTQVHAIHGTGGVGKTQLAARYAREHRDDYDVIWWLRAEQPETLRADLAGLAVTLGLVGDDIDEQDAIDTARGWLEQHRRWLLVFDNATGSDAIAGLLPEGVGGHVLITSRTHADWRALNAKPLMLDVWRRTESLRFLTKRTGERDRTPRDEVAAALGDLPLALEQAAAYTIAKGITLAGYLERLRHRAPELFSANRPEGYEHTVSTVWQMAFDEIAKDPVASNLLGVCAQMAPERIPRELLERAAEHSDAPAAAEQAVDEAIELLLRYALLTPASEQTFGMHRLTSQLTRTAADPMTQARAATGAVGALDDLWPKTSWEHEQWPASQRLLAHALFVTNQGVAQTAAPATTAALRVEVGRYQLARAEMTSARNLMERALATYTDIYGPEHIRVATTLNSLSLVLKEQGELAAALAAQERALTIKQTYGGTHKQVATSLQNLGNVLREQGDLAAARLAQERALAMRTVTDRPKPREIAQTLDDLGNTLLQQGDLHAARTAKERALAIFEDLYGPEHPDVAITLSNLGAVLGDLGEHDTARSHLERALKIKEGVYGPDHVEVASTLGNLGVLSWQLGELAAARTYIERALAIFQRMYGNKHADVSIALTNLGGVLMAMGDLDAARSNLQQAVTSFESVQGPGHPYVAHALRRLEKVLEKLGDSAAAHAVHLRLQSIANTKQHPDPA